MTPEAVVRPGRREEIPDVLGLWREAGSVPSVSDDPASLERLLETSKDALLVAETDGRVVGTIIAGWEGWRANFYRLAVLPATSTTPGWVATSAPWAEERAVLTPSAGR